MEAQRARGFGIFSCDGSALYDAPVARKAAWGSFANTDEFIQIWDRVRNEGVYANHDWVVKVDPDAVLIPSRLRARVAELRVPSGRAVYLQNCDFKFHFMGALEIMTKEALEMYFMNKGNCSKYLGHEGGEDFWMKSCLNAIGVSYMTDFTLLNDKYTLGTPECRAAGNCKYDVRDVSPCASPVSVAFHPYKDIDVWIQCHDKAKGSVRFLQQ
jgi:hypothetical protein